MKPTERRADTDEERAEEVPENWTIRLLPKAPDMQTQDTYKVPSIYYTTAEEIQNNPELKGGAFSFKETTSSREIGIQVLTSVGWRPDCAPTQKVFVQRLPPPPTRRRARLFLAHQMRILT